MSMAISMLIQSRQNSDALLQELYNKKSGFSIDSNENALIESNGGNATYGEITDQAVQKIIDELKPKKNDVFYDLGSGVGRMSVKMYLDSPVKKSIGVELAPTRHNQAVAVKTDLKRLGKIDINRSLEFLQEDILKANIDDATIIYLASTCFSNNFMKQITDRLAKLKKGLHVLTLRQLPNMRSFKLIKQYSLPMTWSNDVNVYLYELVK
jgi:SAM-dependent methyltransferase